MAAEAWAQSHGASYLDGANMTTPPGVGDSGQTLLYSGSSAVMTAHRATLPRLGDPVFLGPDPGLASLYDSGLLGLMWATFTGWLHGTAMITADGATAVDYTNVAVRRLKAMSGFMTTYAAKAAGHGLDSFGSVIEVLRR